MTNTVASAALISFVPVYLVLFARSSTRIVAICGLLAAWLFLPIATLDSEGNSLPALTKDVAAVVAVGLGVILFDRSALRNAKLSLIDVPMLLWLVIPCASSLSNGLGLYDGLASVFEQTMAWGLPWFIGRWYFGRAGDLRLLAWGLVVALVVYVPFMLFEVRMSPQLHYWIYGEYQSQFAQTIRFGRWRPMVFMTHGLMVGLFVAAGATVGYWIATCRPLDRPLGLPAGAWRAFFLLAAVSTLSVNGWGLVLFGIAVLVVSQWWKSTLLVTAPLAACGVYVAARLLDVAPVDEIVNVADHLVGTRRGQSIQFRFGNESVLVRRALRRPWLGWGGFGRASIISADGQLRSVADSLWIIVIGQYGLLGLVSLATSVTAPLVLFAQRHPPSVWRLPAVLPAAALLVVSVQMVLNWTLNAHHPPYLLVVVGALGSAAVGRRPLDDLSSFVAEPFRLSSRVERSLLAAGWAIAASLMLIAYLEGAASPRLSVPITAGLGAVAVGWSRYLGRQRVAHPVD